MRRLEDFNPNLHHSTEDYQCIITFNEQTFVDKTNWTILSNFIAFPVLLACALKICYFPYQRKACHGWDRQQIVERLVPLYLFMEAMSHGFLGLFHLTVTNAESQNLWESVAQMFGIFASVVYFLFAIMVVLSCQQTLSKWVQMIWRLGISGLWLAIIYAYLFDGSGMFSGISLHMYILVGIAMLLLLAYCIRIAHHTPSSENTSNGPGHFFVKSLALLVIIIATTYSYNVYKKCGSYSGYLECFIRCPLPGGLNHTSFYNLVKVGALFLWAMAEDYCPSVSLYQLHLGLRDDEATVISDGADDSEELMDNKDEEDENDGENEGTTAEHQQQIDIESNSEMEARDTNALDSESQPANENLSMVEADSADEPVEKAQVKVDDESASSPSPSAPKETVDEEAR